MEVDFAIVKEAGLTQQEFADLAGVSRVMVCRYMRNNSGVGKHARPAVVRALKIVTAAVKLGKLPGELPRSSRHTLERRKEMLDRIVQDILTLSRQKRTAPAS